MDTKIDGTLLDREILGGMVRRAWVDYCKEVGDQKPSHIAGWYEMEEWEREVDRRIGEKLRDYIVAVLSRDEA